MLRLAVFVFPAALLGCTASTPAPAPPAADGDVAVVDLSATRPPAEEPKEPSPKPDAPPQGEPQEPKQAGTLRVLESGDGAEGASGSRVLESGQISGALAGIGGLGLQGTSAGGGPGNATIGIGSIGAHGHGSSTVASGPTTVSAGPGRLPPEVVKAAVRPHLARIRFCYEQALLANPTLRGKVSVKFVIGQDGTVRSAVDNGSDLPDSAVVSCVVAAFAGLTFPKPEGGIVTVVYPVQLEPGASGAPAPPPKPAPAPAKRP